MKIQGCFEADEKRTIARAILHESKHALGFVIPGLTAKRRPEFILSVVPDIQNAVAWWRQQPLVGARKIGVASEILKINFHLAYGLCPIDHTKASVFVRELGELFGGHHDAARKEDVSKSQHPGARSHRCGEQIHQLLRVI